MGYKTRDSSIQQKVLYTGNNTKSLHMSVEASLKKLRTTYIDLLYVHWWDWDTSIEEVMKSLHALVLQGKVLYLVSPIEQYGYRSSLIILHRVYRTLLHGSSQRQISTRGTTL